MDDRGKNTASALKKSKKKKKHKPKKTGVQTETTHNYTENSTHTVDGHLANEKPPGPAAVNADTGAVPTSVATASEYSIDHPHTLSRNSKSWVHSFRKENSLNRAVEENHSNTLTENSIGNPELDTNANRCEESVVQDRLQDQSTADSASRDTCVSERAKHHKDSVQNKQKESAMPEYTGSETGQKTKAQLKAERKAAFEAQQREQLPQKAKATSKAERRAVQEAQRAKKAPNKPDIIDEEKSTQPSTGSPTSDTTTKGPKPLRVGLPASAKTETEKPRNSESAKTATTTILEKKVVKKARLFSHLPQYQWNEDFTSDVIAISAIHPAVIRMGLQIAQGLIMGSNARTVAMMLAFKQVIEDYTTPPQKELSRDLEGKLQPYISFLNKCRPLSAGMENEVKKLKWEINHIPSDMSDAKAKKKLCDAIELNVKNDITLAEEAICLSICSKILDGDVIMTYSCSSVVKGVLADAYANSRRFRVIVVDSRPRLEGREMVRYLVKKDIPCSYVLINAVSYVMKEVTKVILGAHSLQANGYVMSRVGSSQIALIAAASNVPVLVCCETYKFSERVHTDSFVYNELGNPNDLVTTTPPHKCSLANWKEIPSLRLLNLAYDVTPPNLVTAVITDLGMLPCTSVPVVLRVKHVAVQEQ